MCRRNIHFNEDEITSGEKVEGKKERNKLANEKVNDERLEKFASKLWQKIFQLEMNFSRNVSLSRDIGLRTKNLDVKHAPCVLPTREKKERV